MNDTATFLALRQLTERRPAANSALVASKVRLLDAAVENATERLTAATGLDYTDVDAVRTSQGALAAALDWVLRALDEEREARDRAADVADEVAAEDGYRFVGVPYQRGTEAA
ncbi:MULTISPECIES: hypothetical protein [Streptomyces]|uniref:hypothetical protein n=1 Tax=Streptomyces TaxID=1883 RepID=UPI000DF9DD68|nr:MULTISPECIES: hypothetical protein [Streptomyces]MBT3077568.1 hypothetical protein [Streptomyces sp. COG21]MBT3084413.1 hypothetical protein [Streptomyces sp. COG20]MBT3086985.1 hypothetical protein [Streptomyces sp. CYG21]MBT3098739.1 hypothetical protein [Streptomyces sp. CBG30]MBT3103637.1 hypothetical protein [Streptomyces sp. COG19]